MLLKYCTEIENRVSNVPYTYIMAELLQKIEINVMNLLVKISELTIQDLHESI